MRVGLPMVMRRDEARGGVETSGYYMSIVWRKGSNRHGGCVSWRFPIDVRLPDRNLGHGLGHGSVTILATIAGLPQ